MPRYIDASEFRKRIDRYPPDIRDIAKKELRYTPTADVVEVVRCKNCKRYDFSEVNITPFSEWYKCRATGMYTPQNHYCSFGERREDE